MQKHHRATQLQVKEKQLLYRKLKGRSEANYTTSAKFAADCVNAAIKLFPENPEAYLQALPCYTALCEKDPKDEHVKQMLAYLQKLNQLAPNRVPKHQVNQFIIQVLEISRARSVANNHEQAISLLEAGALHFKEDHRFPLEIGIAKLALGRKDEAKASFKKANTLKPNNSRVLEQLEALKEKPSVVKADAKKAMLKKKNNRSRNHKQNQE